MQKRAYANPYTTYAVCITYHICLSSLIYFPASKKERLLKWFPLKVTLAQVDASKTPKVKSSKAFVLSFRMSCEFRTFPQPSFGMVHILHSALCSGIILMTCGQAVNATQREECTGPSPLRLWIFDNCQLRWDSIMTWWIYLNREHRKLSAQVLSRLNIPQKNATKRNWQLQQKTQDAMIPLPLALGFGSSQEAPQDSLPILWSISLAFDVSFALQIWMPHQIQNLQNGIWLLRFIACNSNWK